MSSILQIQLDQSSMPCEQMGEKQESICHCSEKPIVPVAVERECNYRTPLL